MSESAKAFDRGRRAAFVTGATYPDRGCEFVLPRPRRPDF